MELFGINLKADLLLAPILALIVPIIWNFASIPISWLREFFMKKPAIIHIGIDLEYKELKNAVFKCLVVRYGTDEYIKSMANDQEKYDGRLRNEIVDATHTNGVLSFNIPLHKRIGTQFKCFLEVDTKEEAEEIVKQCDKFDGIYDLSFSSSQHKNRVFFLLKDYGETLTVDKLKNNMLFPI
jgi:hypothetical protein